MKKFSFFVLILVGDASLASDFFGVDLF